MQNKVKKPLLARKHEVDEFKKRFNSADVIIVAVGGNETEVYPAKTDWDGFVTILQNARCDAIKCQCQVDIFSHCYNWGAGVHYLIAYLNRWGKYDLIV